MTSWLTCFLRFFNPEIAHSIAMAWLKTAQKIMLWFPSRETPKFKVQIQVAPSSLLKLSNRLGLAAGFDKQGEAALILSALGFGFVEVGTVTPLPQSGNPVPRVWRIPPDALVNHFGFNSVGLEKFKANIKKYRRHLKAPLFANIGKNKETPLDSAVQDYRSCIVTLENWVEGFVINISSPNTPGLGSLQSVEFLKSLVPVLSSSQPTWIKFSPDLDGETFSDLCEFISAEKKLAGVVLVNTSRQLAEAKGFKVGGLSGRPLFDQSMTLVQKARALLGEQKIIIGVGGVSSVADALSLREAGADLVEIYTAFVYQGPKVVREISRSLQ